MFIPSHKERKKDTTQQPKEIFMNKIFMRREILISFSTNFEINKQQAGECNQKFNLELGYKRIIIGQLSQPQGHVGYRKKNRPTQQANQKKTAKEAKRYNSKSFGIRHF